MSHSAVSANAKTHQSKDIKAFTMNVAKFGVSLFILPFISMEKRAAKRGRPATPEETAEFNKFIENTLSIDDVVDD